MRFIYILLVLFIPNILNSSNFSCINNGYNIELDVDIYRAYLSKNIKIDDNYNLDRGFKKIDNLQISYNKSLLTIFKYLTNKNNFAVYDSRLKVLKIINQNLMINDNKFIKLTVNNYKYPPVRIKLNISNDDNNFLDIAPDIISYSKGFYDLYFRIPNEITNDISNLYFFSIDSDKFINKISIGNIDEQIFSNIFENKDKFQKSYNDLETLNELELYPFGLETIHNQLVLFNENNQLLDVRLIRTPLPYNYNMNNLNDYNIANCNSSKIKIYFDNNDNNYFNNILNSKYEKIKTISLKPFNVNLNDIIKNLNYLNYLSLFINEKSSFNITFSLVLILFSIFIAFKNRDYINQLLVNICLIDSIFLSINNSFIFLLPIVFSNFFNKKKYNYLLLLCILFLVLFFLKDFLTIKFMLYLPILLLLIFGCINFIYLRYVFILIFDYFLFINLDYSLHEIYFYPLIIFQSLIFFKFLVDKIKGKHVIFYIIAIILISSLFTNIFLASILSVPLLLLITKYFMSFKV